MKRILITGIKGFIGSSLKDFIEKNFSCYGVYGIDASLRKSSKRYFKGDVKDRFFLRRTIEEIRPHYIFHLAGSTKAQDFTALISSNVLATKQLLDSILSLKNFKPRIIIPGSAAEYGQVLQKDMPVKEDYPLKPINLYGLSKMYQTELASSYSRKGSDVVIGRIFNIIGWATPDNFSIGKFAYVISLIQKGSKKPVLETKGLDSERDYVDIQDVCFALMAIAENGKSGNIYNICSGRSYKIKYLLDYLLKLSDVGNVKIKTIGSPCLEIKMIKGSNRKIVRDTGWKPKVSILESLQNTLYYYRRLV